MRSDLSVALTQRLFRQHFNIGRHGRVPERHTTTNWVIKFRATAFVVDKKPDGSVKSVRTQENIDRVRSAVHRSPRRSVRKQAAALNVSKSSVCRSMHAQWSIWLPSFGSLIMGNFTMEQRLKQGAYCRRFQVKNGPSATVIRKLMRHFEERSCTMNLPPTCRPRSACNEENTEQVGASVEEEPQTSMTRRTCKIQLVKEPKPVRHYQRRNYAIRGQELVGDNHELIHQLITSDEAHIDLNGFVTKQNCRFWGTANPTIIHQRLLHATKCTVWCGVTSQEVIGPYSFNLTMMALTITGDRYRDTNDSFFFPPCSGKSDFARLQTVFI
ncbi:hypothetical protein PR048_023280 [Dryococelus australis]|uniref:DUF4817 domain-containing protein n=1 Tax=Dryococelus australis TaxID=614101 RepID=A0ABQ9GTP6_9NEOP|nr:hypothetical protein PR048_023280 [Dryococelus australis]